jgi:hypothetical protein
MPDKKLIAIAAGALLIYSGWTDANVTTATTQAKTIGWVSVGLGALLVFQAMK